MSQSDFFATAIFVRDFVSELIYENMPEEKTSAFLIDKNSSSPHFSIVNLPDFPDPRNWNYITLSASTVELRSSICQMNAADYILQNEYEIRIVSDLHPTVNFRIGRKLRSRIRRNSHEHLAGYKVKLLYCWSDLIHGTICLNKSIFWRWFIIADFLRQWVLFEKIRKQSFQYLILIPNWNLRKRYLKSLRVTGLSFRIDRIIWLGKLCSEA